MRKNFNTFKAILPPLIFAGLSATLSIFIPYLLPLAFIGIADAAGRYKDYKYLSRFKYIPLRLVIFYGRSFCGRNVVLTIDPDWRRHYRRAGYRWYHVLPDGFPTVIFKLKFWRTLFGGHRR